MVGSAPSSNTTATVTTYIIPVKITITNRNGTKTSFDPSHVLSHGNTVTTNTVKSPFVRCHHDICSGRSQRWHHAVHRRVPARKLLGHGFFAPEFASAAERQREGGTDSQPVADLWEDGERFRL